jgi:hypothetical protein
MLKSGYTLGKLGHRLVKQGMYRTRDPFLGECARVHWWVGDGAPYLQREVYQTVKFNPVFDELPTEEEYLRRHRS